jgi:hypothetical protein
MLRPYHRLSGWRAHTGCYTEQFHALTWLQWQTRTWRYRALAQAHRTVLRQRLDSLLDWLHLSAEQLERSGDGPTAPLTCTRV